MDHVSIHIAAQDGKRCREEINVLSVSEKMKNGLADGNN